MDGCEASDVRQELKQVESELEHVEQQITELLLRQEELTSLKNALLCQLEETCDSVRPSSSSSSSSNESKTVPLMSKQELARYDGTDFPWSKAADHHLKDTFHLSQFRPLQLRAINLSLSGKDLFLVMPTGRGKSLCYQLPALCSKGFTLVITPLVSLMEDQIMYLKSIEVSAAMLNASSSKEQAKTVMTGMTDAKCPFKLVYVTPEKIAKSKLLMSRLEKAYNAKLLSHIAVDEVHCCSQWGHDFRPDYKLLGILKRQFPKVPLLGLTATATSSVLKDCEKILCVSQPLTLTASFNRSNLYYEVRSKDSNSDTSLSDIASLIKNRYKNQSGIVYVFSQKDAESVSSELQKRDIVAYPYHANMDPEDKSRIHRKWTSNKIQVVVATVAFGMGIDKPNVRFVIHHTISKSIENYYQESGRAGRDDLPADCIVYYGFADIFRISTMVVMENVGQQKLLQMVDYCHNVDRCRRSLMAVHFDEVWDDEDCNQMCDTCRNKKEYTSFDITQHARQVVQILELAASMDEKMTPLKLIEAWTGKGPAKRRKMIETTSLPRCQAEAVVVRLLQQGYLREDFSFTPYTTHFYLKLGRKAPLLKNQTHKLSMNMRTTGAAAEAWSNEEELDMTFDPSIPDCRGQQKPVKEHRNLRRKKDSQRVSQLDLQIERSNVEPDEAAEHVSHEHILANAVEKIPPEFVKNPNCKSNHKFRSKPWSNSSKDISTIPHFSSQASVISETTAEELCDLRNYYSRQLRRINYMSHEHLGQAPRPGVLACLSEPLKSLRLPVSQTARSLWTRVSGRRKLLQR